MDKSMEIKTIVQKNLKKPNHHKVTLSYRNELEGIGYDIIGDTAEDVAEEMAEIFDKLWKESETQFILNHPSITKERIIFEDVIDAYEQLDASWYGGDGHLEPHDFIIEVMKVLNVKEIIVEDNELPRLSMVRKLEDDDLGWGPLEGEDKKKWHREFKNGN